MKVLECYNLKKKIKEKYIINNANMDIEEGEILGFIGKNGAGKTTIIKMILGLSKITEGNIYLMRHNIEEEHDKALSKIGAIIESPDLYMYLTGYQNLKLIANLYKLSLKDIDKVVDIVNLKDSINKKVKTYSLGMRQRLGIAAALLNDPKLLIFDEPFNGLDPVGVKDIKNIFMRLAYQENKSILISSHILSELETFCNRICVLKDGQIFYIDINNNSNNIYLFKVDNTNKLKELEIDATVIDNSTFKVNSSFQEIPSIIQKVTTLMKVYEVIKIRKTLEDIFLEKVGE